jgi:hypothetical protein
MVPLIFLSDEGQQKALADQVSDCRLISTADDGFPSAGQETYATQDDQGLNDDFEHASLLSPGCYGI